MRHSFLPWVVFAVVLAGATGCGTQFTTQTSEREYDNLRLLVIDQRRVIDDLREEQGQMRAAIEQLQYRTFGRPVAGARPQGSMWPEHPGSAPAPFTAPQPGLEEFSGSVGAGDAGLDGADAQAALGSAGGVSGAPDNAPAVVGRAASSRTKLGPSGGLVPTVPQELSGSTYEAGVRALIGGDYDASIQDFRTFIRDRPSSAFADDAQYWIGEAYFRQNRYHRAIIEFNQVALNFGTGDRAPAALVRQAQAFQLVGDRVDTRLSLQKVINRYPGTAEAARASELLGELGG